MLFLFFDFTPLYGLDHRFTPKQADYLGLGGGSTPEMQFLVHLGGHKFLSEFNNDNNSCQNTEVLVT